MNESYITILGPVSSGKTTYFAALWWLLKNPYEPYLLTIDSRSDDRTYLNQIGDTWSLVKPIEHTKSQEWQPMELRLKNSLSQERLIIHTPDLPGEQFEIGLSQRLWSEDFRKSIDSSDGLLLFINIKKVQKPVFLDEFAGVIDLEEDSALDLNPWEPSSLKVPMDVYLTDMLQQIIFYKPDQKFCLSIVLTGWDRIVNSKTESIKKYENAPELWLKEELPLLHQFITCRALHFDATYHGVSAYGGDQSNPKTVTELKKLNPHERVTVVVDGAKTRDITLPLRPFFGLR